ncbi:hypothetical protein FH972_026527 [Carpinus fangiana]|uniref:LIP-domain-containing protein n=1 Tax=Carpinus fangiana TaxID=176857 RepID=A0A5N6L489_9ROSI|nr:hypothetical protein FH972_026527 [Carpinus fangiana]
MLLNNPSLGLLALLCHATTSFGAPSSGLVARQSPGLPSQDPFYQPPSGFESLPLGSILRNRTLPNLTKNMGLQGAYQLLYSSQDDVGRRGGIVTTILIPKNANFTKHFAYHAPYDTADPDCSPSYPLSLGNAPGGLDAQAINSALQQGIPVSTPDYEGPDAAFTAGPQSAFGTLDSIKAVLASKNITGILPTAKTVLFGYSGGSIAVEWASEYHASYAPNVNIVAAALGGLVVNINTAFETNVNTSNPGIEFAQLNGLAASYPDFGNWLDGALVSSKKSDFYRAKTSCDLGIYSNQNLYSYFTNGSATFKQKTYTDLINKAGIMGKHFVPKDFPLWIYKGTADEVVPTIADTDNLVKGYCNNNATIKYFRYINGTHSSTLNLTPQALNFLFTTINGTAVAKGCTTTNVSP